MDYKVRGGAQGATNSVREGTQGTPEFEEVPISDGVNVEMVHALTGGELRGLNSFGTVTTFARTTSVQAPNGVRAISHTDAVSPLDSSPGGPLRGRLGYHR